MLLCGAAVSIGQLDPNVSLDSAREIWADVLRDADQFGLHATRVSAAKEMQLGAEMASQDELGSRGRGGREIRGCRGKTADALSEPNGNRLPFPRDPVAGNQRLRASRRADLRADRHA